jgi:hypothetical protein
MTLHHGDTMREQEHRKLMAALKKPSPFVEAVNKRDGAGQVKMLREWYREVVDHSAFMFASNGDQFLTVHMKSPQAKSQKPKAAIQ